MITAKVQRLAAIKGGAKAAAKGAVAQGAALSRQAHGRPQGQPGAHAALAPAPAHGRARVAAGPTGLLPALCSPKARGPRQRCVPRQEGWSAAQLRPGGLVPLQRRWK